MKASVIISTYNSPEWLEKVLWGYSVQTFTDFEIVIADDGSTSSTKEMLKTMSKHTNLKINHIWHSDEGFQKTRILNKAVLATKTDYIIFTDGDCIPRKDFVKAHISHREDNTFLSGGHFPLSMKISHLIRKDDVLAQRCFDLNWLKEKGLKPSFKNIKLTKKQALSEFMNAITPTKSTWNGGNASAWKKDILALNGFDERMQYGGEDREFGERLINFGINPKRVRYFAIIVHLEHKRGYVNEEAWKKNNEIRQETKKTQKTKTEFGLNLHMSPKSQ
ncbi:glycosyltransferase family 2 protein [Mesohalobacter halotolerans]|uniref:Glycosyltransferase n=1 Tax=Mesohalobacter halotolerans TaxID=1883405 RepID=A0A4U5TSZ9_9FLAO|nr:glycosyltransferase family 2 protein [Mesohalobacter halotolerans]MBS3739069.1 glycosyltransferase family 2 protein [Psychroflexus sp.]TKS56408.1 glycosyltransferase [Mesohalobacter halotolerans]